MDFTLEFRPFRQCRVVGISVVQQYRLFTLEQEPVDSIPYLWRYRGEKGRRVRIRRARRVLRYLYEGDHCKGVSAASPKQGCGVDWERGALGELERRSCRCLGMEVEKVPR